MTTEDSRSAQRRNFQRGVSLAAWARLSPDRTAIHSAYGDRSFSQLDQNCDRVAQALTERGLRPGGSLALLCPNRPEFVEVMFAAERAGFRVTPMRPDLTPREAAYMISDCRAEAIIMDGGLDGPLVDLLSGLSGMKAKFAIGSQIAGTEYYEETLANAGPPSFEKGQIGIPMFYTSGTTGLPKGVYRSEPVSHPAMVAVGERVKLGSDRDLALALMPLCRSGLFNLSARLPLVCGVSVVLVGDLAPIEILEVIAARRITYAYMAPNVFHGLFQLPDAVRRGYDTRSLRNVVHTGAPCPVALKHRLIDWLGPIVTECYGGTEGGNIVISSDEWLNKPGSVGKGSGRVTIHDEDGDELAANVVGEIFLAAPERGRFEYFNAPEKTSAAYRGNSYTMGDYGFLDEDGYLFITGRSAEIINFGGLKVYPSEVDAILLEHPAIQDAACVGVPNPEMGEEVKAFIKLRAGWAQRDLRTELAVHCGKFLAPYKCPRSFEFVDDVPRLDTGKLLRDQLRRQHSENVAPGGEP
jgi:long-chain acyl-CoA synthetase